MKLKIYKVSSDLSVIERVNMDYINNHSNEDIMYWKKQIHKDIQGNTPHLYITALEGGYDYNIVIHFEKRKIKSFVRSQFEDIIWAQQMAQSEIDRKKDY